MRLGLTHAASFASGGMVGKGKVVFGRGCAFWTALIWNKPQCTFFHRELGRSLNVDDGARLAGVGLNHRELASDASRQQCASHVAFRITRAHDYELAVKLLPLGEEISRNPEGLF